jgi:hypothetical protein
MGKKNKQQSAANATDQSSLLASDNERVPDAAGLTVTAPAEPEVAPVADVVIPTGTPGGMEVIKGEAWDHEYDEDEFEEESDPADRSSPAVDANLVRDPNATVAAAILFIAKLYNDAGIASVALTGHLRKHADQPELFAYMQRMQHLIGDFRHGAEQITSGISESLSQAIRDSVA